MFDPNKIELVAAASIYSILFDDKTFDEKALKLLSFSPVFLVLI
jgi:hypothetical protein